MAVPLIHRCGHCGYESEISSSLSAFTENPFCRQCGLSASESDSKLQDELSSLINQHLTLSQPTIAEKQLGPASPITYITQHYHHSNHLVTSPREEDPTTQQLASHGIDVSALSQSQLRLYTNAQPEQQARLIELWRIAPPTLADRDMSNWPQTSMEQEELLARTRYLKLTSPITLEQPPNFRHEQPVQFSENHAHAEPYMVQGYAAHQSNIISSPDQLQANYSPSLDPVYQQLKDNQNLSREWWARTNDAQPMEHQYGALMQMKELYEGTTPTVGIGREEDMW